jgi:hypothetical protein
MIFSKELGCALEVAAKSVNVRIVCPDNVKPFGIVGHDCVINGGTIDLFFNQLYSGNTKKLLLNVEVPEMKPDSKMEIAKVSLNYGNPSGDAKSSLNASVTVTFSGEEKKVKESVNMKVVEDYAVMQNAVAKDEAIKKADRGKMKEASMLLRQSAEKMNAVAAETKNAEMAAQAQQSLKQADELEKKDTIRPEARKELKGQSYQMRNSQMFKQ